MVNDLTRISHHMEQTAPVCHCLFQAVAQVSEKCRLIDRQIRSNALRKKADADRELKLAVFQRRHGNFICRRIIRRWNGRCGK